MNKRSIDYLKRPPGIKDPTACRRVDGLFIANIFFLAIFLAMIVGLIFGRLVLKLNPVLLFGALTGAETVTPALNALKEGADSSTPALGFAVPYAFGNVILTVWGTVIVHLLR